MALSKAKSGSAWQSHFWQCGTLRPARNTKLLHYASKSKLGFVQAARFNATGEDHFLESKKPMCLRPRKWDCCSDLFAKNGAALPKSNTFASVTEWRIPGNTVADWRSLARLHVASLCQSTMLFGIVWVLLSQAFATWRGEVLIPLRQCWRMLFLCLRLRSFVLVSWCVVCFWAPPFASLDS